MGAGKKLGKGETFWSKGKKIRKKSPRWGRHIDFVGRWGMGMGGGLGMIEMYYMYCIYPRPKLNGKKPYFLC